ncbi:TfuA-like protein [Parafrankia elaeagni]|uniref:TfuA-like protein n=1 Tax=Parafrankia elaeagni TaxID=222534 RepID=UPI000A0556A1|nr:TfuA-like protein [Parafrankia elaeagni]
MITVFLGPTLGRCDAKRIVDAQFLQPAACGDVLRAALVRPQAIVIIDGIFESAPAIWHKEILWALKEGIPVFGASSMGALRAAELDRFGMVGVGEIYSRFASGELSDDDEVAVMHGPAASGYRLASEAMVNMRITLVRAAREGIISQETSDVLVKLAKNAHYPDRVYPLLIDQASAICPSSELRTLHEWLPTGRVDQKMADAEEALRRVSLDVASSFQAPAQDFTFAHTAAFERLLRRVATDAHPAGSG